MGKEFENQSKERSPKELNQELASLLDQLPKNPNLLPNLKIDTDMTSAMKSGREMAAELSDKLKAKDSKKEEVHDDLPIIGQQVFPENPQELFDPLLSVLASAIVSFESEKRLSSRRSNSEHKKNLLKKVSGLIENHADVTRQYQEYALFCLDQDYTNGINLDGVSPQTAWLLNNEHPTSGGIFNKKYTPNIERSGYKDLQNRYIHESTEFENGEAITTKTELIEPDGTLTSAISCKKAKDRLGKLHGLVQGWPESFQEKYGQPILPPKKSTK